MGGRSLRAHLSSQNPGVPPTDPVGPPLLQFYQESSPFLLRLLFLLPFFESFNLLLLC